MGVFGLVRLGGGPEEEAMPGAMAQQAAEECGCVMRRERSQGEVEREGKHTKWEGGGDGRKSRSDA